MSKEQITEYQTIKSSSESEFKDRGSRFYGYLLPVSSREQIDASLAELREQHAKSRHVCYGYRLSDSSHQEIEEVANDAGEPSGSAGLPILNVLRSSEITNVLGVVVRYFGGTKLGIPGLIHAYKAATQDALDQNDIITKAIERSFTITAGFDQAHKVYPLVDQHGGRWRQQIVDQHYQFEICIPLTEAEVFEAKVRECYGITLM